MLCGINLKFKSLFNYFTKSYVNFRSVTYEMTLLRYKRKPINPCLPHVFCAANRQLNAALSLSLSVPLSLALSLFTHLSRSM